MDDLSAACLELAPGSTVLVRADFNLSRDGQGQWILNKRLHSVLPLIKQLVARQFAVVLVSHLGRPREGVWEERYSLSSLCEVLEKLLGKQVNFLSHWPFQKTYLAAGTIALAENTRFLQGECENDMMLAKQMVEGVDLVVMEAFACSHRAHASTVGILRHGKRACLGPAHQHELNGVKQFLRVDKPRVALIGGKKISTKLPLLTKLLETVDHICLGGGIASTILHANGFSLGTSWVEYSCLDEVERFCSLAKQRDVTLSLPCDVAVTDDMTGFQHRRFVQVDSIMPHECIVDVGPETVDRYSTLISEAKSVYWNGPMGIYEYRAGMQATSKLANVLVNCAAYTLVGGGDTLSALELLNVEEFSHLSTGGGAFLHYLAHGSTPTLDALRAKERQNALETN